MAMSKRVLPFVVYFPLSINDLGMLRSVELKLTFQSTLRNH